MRLRAYFTGGLRRSDIGARCGTIAAASRDSESGQDIVPKNLDRDLASRCHRPAHDFKPVFKLNANRVLASLLQGFREGKDLRLKAAVSSEGLEQRTNKPISKWGAITRDGVWRSARRWPDMCAGAGLSAGVRTVSSI
ncbi:hypothetical protein [Burkholderia vietnamiensis]|uniref:hypothetical protein n=1 Tax=Burkholderia vietnamiensis TaxID=60552 RepID=UPI000D86AAF9|nr:hypothetical protein [Burkholderia vietnamiensis]GBH28700.1 hypothetical protein BvRS1_57490 [Burkholderia vietnamiensis]